MELMWMLLFVLTWLLLRMLQIFSSVEKPTLYYKDKNSPFINSIIDMCPTFNTVFQPTMLWGKSGHIQTVLHVKLGRVKPKWPDSQRFHILMPDGATMSYDVFAPPKDGPKANFTLALCPGIASTSECLSMRTFASLGQNHGYRVAILNHLGALKSEKLTAPRIFTYGGTEEYDTMINHILKQHPETKILAVGFSMGGNIVCKYLGESEEHQKKVLCGMSFCQGYEINKAKNLFLQWSSLRRVYSFLITINMRKVITRHRHLLFSEETKKLYNGISEGGVFRATSLSDIDESYSCLRAGFRSAFDYYKKSSSAYYVHNIKVPMLFMNALDDPLCPSPVLRYPKEFVEKTDNCIFMTTKHGGHLGYFEGGFMIPRHPTLIDRVILEYADAVISMYKHGSLPRPILINDSTEELENEYETVVESGAARGSVHFVTDPDDFDRDNGESSKENNGTKVKNGHIPNGRLENSAGSLELGSGDSDRNSVTTVTLNPRKSNGVMVENSAIRSNGTLGHELRDKDSTDGLNQRRFNGNTLEPPSSKYAEGIDSEEKEQRGSLKRGSFLQQATSYVQ